ncbi:hypothetical protein LCGC14_3000810 [marine sediment metagenome]|uniref:Uncharacterized protein n=1 Tax=marine sediment metagenome TaxID=412755 RepID=A0A0F8XNP4_9ZZZZ
MFRCPVLILSEASDDLSWIIRIAELQTDITSLSLSMNLGILSYQARNWLRYFQMEIRRAEKRRIAKQVDNIKEVTKR